MSLNTLPVRTTANIVMDKQQVVFILGCLEMYSKMNPGIHNVRDELYPEGESQIDVLISLFESLLSDMNQKDYNQNMLNGFCL